MPSFKFVRFSTLLLVVAVIGLNACGGSDSDGDSSGSPVYEFDGPIAAEHSPQQAIAESLGDEIGKAGGENDRLVCQVVSDSEFVECLAASYISEGCIRALSSGDGLGGEVPAICTFGQKGEWGRIVVKVDPVESTYTVESREALVDGEWVE